MPRQVAVAVLAVAICLGFPSGAPAQSVSKDPSHAPAGAYRLVAAHSQILFSIAHMGLTDYFGRFDKLSGNLDFDPNEPEKSAVAVTIDAHSIDTPSDRLNDDLKSSSVFAVDQFPSASFKSVSVIRTGPDTGRITGDLTIKGVTKSVTLDVVYSGSEPDPLTDAYALGFHATATIKRSDFGLTGMVWEPLVGGDVKLIIEAMFEHEKD
jgi:polyisoprenoid-binding protein YceI